MLGTAKLIRLLNSIKEDILKHYRDEKVVKQIILFGSYAKNCATSKSDVDILVLFEDGTSTTSDLCFSHELAEKYKLVELLHLCFESYKYYIGGAEDYYKDVPNYGKVVYDNTKNIVLEEIIA